MQCSENFTWTSEEGGFVQATAEFTVRYRVRHEYGPGLSGKWTVIEPQLDDMLAVKIWAGCVGDEVPVCGDFATALAMHIEDLFDASDGNGGGLFGEVERHCIADYEKQLALAD